MENHNKDELFLGLAHSPVEITLERICAAGDNTDDYIKNQ
jgi:hypothetical protein